MVHNVLNSPMITLVKSTQEGESFRFFRLRFKLVCCESVLLLTDRVDISPAALVAMVVFPKQSLFSCLLPEMLKNSMRILGVRELGQFALCGFAEGFNPLFPTISNGWLPLLSCT
jgi:hypothetical protein